MNRRGEVCECGHWSDRHKEEWNEETHESYWPCSQCKECDDFRGDPTETRERRNEHLVLQDDIRRRK